MVVFFGLDVTFSSFPFLAVNKAITEVEESKMGPHMATIMSQTLTDSVAETWCSPTVISTASH